MIITRFAPSPTGHIHLGNMRSCFLNWIFAKKENGKFILRFDDTDKERSKQEFVDSIQEDLKWMNVNHDEIFYQSKRLDRYNEVFDQLILKKIVYPCFESNEELELKKKLLLKAGKPPIYDREALNLSKEEIEKKIVNGERPYWRFKLSQSKVFWDDLVKGSTEVDLASQSDPVLRRADGSYLYHFPSVVDDIDMNISHIIRGEDHLSNTAIHIEIFDSLEKKPPIFGHNPLMLNEDGTKLSKRNFDSITIQKFKINNYLPNAILSYLYSVGLNADFDFEEIIFNKFQDFDISKISNNLPKVDLLKVDNFQKNLLRKMSCEKLINHFNELNDLKLSSKEWDLIKNNIDNYIDIIDQLKIIRRECLEKSPDQTFLQGLVKNINHLVFSDFDSYVKSLMILNKDLTKKDIFMNTRFILTGNDKGPSVKELFDYYGAEKFIELINEFKTF